MSSRRSEPLRIVLEPDAWLQGQWSFASPPSEVGVLFVHGFQSSRYGEKAQAVERACAVRGWNFATFDLRGHGESSGTLRDLRGSGLIADLNAIHAALRNHGIQRLCLVGSSMGAWASAWYGCLHPEAVVAAALIAPGFHFLQARWEKLSPEGREAWKQSGFLRVSNQWIDAEIPYGLYEDSPVYPMDKLARDYHTPTILFQGMIDGITPAERTFAFFQSAACPHLELRVFKDGDHRLTPQKDEIAREACRFFARWL
jgi:pimeloyl-ACP methyl ester carboxylesterase